MRFPAGSFRTWPRVLAEPIRSLINSSFRDGYVSSLWKAAIISPSQDPMSHETDEEFGPISLTPVLSKLAAKHGGEWLTEHVKDVVDQHQFGSLPRYSTVHAMTELCHNWVQSLEKLSMAIRILLLNFRKAFDRVDHHILLAKIANTGLRDFVAR